MDESFPARSSEQQLLEGLNLCLLDSTANCLNGGLLVQQILVELLLLLVGVFGELILDVCVDWGLVNFEQLSDALQEVDSSQDLAEVLAILQHQTVLRLQEISLLVDVLVDLGEELAGSDVGLGQNVVNLLVELLNLGGGSQLDGIVIIDLLDHFDLFGGFFGAFEQLRVAQFVGQNVFVQVHVVNHVQLKQLRDGLVALIVRDHDLQQGHVL